MTYQVIPAVELDLSDDCVETRDYFFRCRACDRTIKIRIGCGSRFDCFCPSCSKRWRRKTRNRYFRGILGMKTPKFLTLTLKKKRSSDAMLKRLMSLWEMRKYLFKVLTRKGYKIRAWAAVVEPPNHVHLIIDSEYIPKWKISSFWNEITRDSFIVDLRTVNVMGDPSQVISYLSKYLSKSSAWDGFNLSLLKGFHLIGSWCLGNQKPKSPICICGAVGLERLEETDAFNRWCLVNREIMPLGWSNKYGIDV